MKEKMKTMLQEIIKTWTAEDIYAISMWLQYDNYNPCKPVVVVGYNTEEQYQKSLSETDERERLDGISPFGYKMRNCVSVQARRQRLCVSGLLQMVIRCMEMMTIWRMRSVKQWNVSLRIL